MFVGYLSKMLDGVLDIFFSVGWELDIYLDSWMECWIFFKMLDRCWMFI